MSKKIQPTMLGSLDFEKVDYKVSWAVSAEIKSEQSDRGAAIMAAAHLEEFIGLAVRGYLEMDEKITESLFDLSGPLGTFSAKSKIAFGLGIIGKSAYTDINHIREIRNKFAHFLVVSDGHLGLDQVTFKSQEIRDRSAALRFPENYKSLPIYNVSDGSYTPADLINEKTINDPRMRYVGTCMGLSIAVYAQLVARAKHGYELITRCGLSSLPKPVEY